MITVMLSLEDCRQINNQKAIPVSPNGVRKSFSTSSKSSYSLILMTFFGLYRESTPVGQSHALHIKVGTY
jgi:hypothetical protein